VTADPGPLAGQVGIVTGGGKGLGRAFARHLAELGAHLVVNNRNRLVDDSGRGPADAVVEEITSAGGQAVPEYSDVTDPQAAGRLIELALSTYGRLDFVVANAAISRPAMFHKSTREDFATVLDANVVALIDLARAASAHMRPQGYGRIVLVASTAGLHGEPTVSAYATSKGAVLALGRTIAVEGAPRGVLTNLLLPYATTPMTDANMDPSYHDTMDPADVAPVVGALVDPTSTLNGQVIVTANGSLRAASSIEWATVALPGGALGPDTLGALLTLSRLGTAHEYPTAQDAFADFAAETVGLRPPSAAGGA
jgi:NAD(P)-dependent dehydrogenase (short-subunit alcohol dehydrogenase family)